MTESPEWITGDQLGLVAVVLTLWLVLILGSGWLVIKAAKFPPPLALVLVLSVVTLVCIAAFVVTRDQVVLQLASVGLGAIAAAVATTWSVLTRRRDEDPEPKDEVDDEE
jgi:hypothetical protein